MPETSVLTLRLDSKVKKQLDKLSKTTSRTRSFLAAEAIRQYVSVNEWQIAEIKKGIEEADRGEFATAKDVQRVINKWIKRAGSVD